MAGAKRVFLLTTGGEAVGSQLEYERSVIASAVGARVELVVKLSAMGADENSPISYARTHRAAELDLVASGLRYTVPRPQGLLDSAPHGSVPICAEDGGVALVDAGDVAAVAAQVLTSDGHAGRTYTLTGPRALSYDGMTAVLSQVAGREIEHARRSPSAFADFLTTVGLARWMAQDLAHTHLVFASGRGSEVSPDISVVTGHEPRTFEAFAREEFAATLAAQVGSGGSGERR